MQTFSLTDVGQIREMNQDYVFCEENSIGCFPNLFIVADGMGGHKAGDLASRLCVEEVVAYIKASNKITPISILNEAVNQANEKIYQESQTHQEYQGMGTTMVGAVVLEKTAYVINVGDSRLYLMRDSLKQVTRDHSLVEEMVRTGKLQKDEMRTHPQKNIITRALGTGSKVQGDCFEIEVEKGDVLLLCSDGLSNMLEDDQIEELIREYGPDMNKTGKALVREANAAGGKDNISVVLIRI